MPRSAADPQNDRELLLQLNAQMERLGEAIDRLDETLKEIEGKRLVHLEKRISELDKWKNEEVGKWKALTVGIGILTLVALALSIFNGHK